MGILFEERYQYPEEEKLRGRPMTFLGKIIFGTLATICLVGYTIGLYESNIPKHKQERKRETSSISQSLDSLLGNKAHALNTDYKTSNTQYIKQNI